MDTIRGFLAVRLDLEVVKSLAAVQLELRDRFKEAHVRVGWVPPPNMHVTIRFLGQVTEPMVHAIEDMLRPVVFEHRRFELEVSGLGVFPSLEKPRVVWAGLPDVSGRLSELYAAVSGRLVGAGFNLEDRPFRSHITLGRIKEGAVDTLAPFLAERRGPFGTTRVNDLYCYRSDLKPSGAEYHAIWRLPLSGSAPAKEEAESKAEAPPADTGPEGEEKP